MKIFYACFFAFCTTVTQAQSIHSKIPVNELSNLYAGLHLQGLVLNDSLFVAAPSNKKGPTRAFWILPSGEVVHINSPELKNKSFVSLAGVGDNIFFYYLEQLKNGIFLRANAQNRQTSLVTTDKALVPVHGSFVSIFPFNKAWYLLSVLDSTNEIHMSTIQGMEKVKHTVIKSPFPLTTGTSPFTFISQDAMVTPLLAASSNKIYQQNRYLYITMDQKASGGKKAQTSLLKVNLETGETETRIFIESSKKYFSTFIYDRYLFKITKSRASGAVISIHSLDDYSLLQLLQ